MKIYFHHKSSKAKANEVNFMRSAQFSNYCSFQSNQQATVFPGTFALAPEYHSGHKKYPGA
jgi:hypothetical protein